jgi:hypothetical protein
MNITNSADLRQTGTFYNDAFSGSNYAIWGGSPFKSEIPELDFFRSLTCWLQDGELGEEDRRKLLYSFMKAYFRYDINTAKLNKYYPNLPIDNLSIKRILNNLCYAYNQKPSRTFDPDNDLLNDFLEKIKLNRTMKQAYKVAKFCNECLIRPVKKNNKFKLEIFTPEYYRIKSNNEGIWKLIAIPFQELDKWGYIQSKFHIWTNEVYQQFNFDWQPVEFEYNGKKQYELPNKYKVIPFAQLKFDPDPDRYGGGMFTVARNQLNLNMIEYIKDENIIFGSVGVWLAKNLNLQDTINPGQAIEKNSLNPDDYDPSLEYIAPTPLWGDIAMARKESRDKMMQDLGLPMSMFSETAGVQSGIALKIDRLELDENRADDIEVLEDFEKELINLVVTVYNTDKDTTLPLIKPFKDMTIDYVETSLMLEPKEELTYYSDMFSKGLMKPSTYLLKTTGIELTDEEVIVFIKENKEYLKQIGETDGSGNTDTGVDGQLQPINDNNEEPNANISTPTGMQENMGRDRRNQETN